MAQVHHGLAIKRLREIRGLKQEALALEMGEHWSQRRISMLEGKEEIDEKILGEVAAALEVTIDQIENFCENSLLQNLRKSAGKEKETEVKLAPNAALLLYKLMQQTEENKALYERLLQSEKEKTELLRQCFIPTTHGNNNGHPINS